MKVLSKLTEMTVWAMRLGVRSICTEHGEVGSIRYQIQGERYVGVIAASDVKFCMGMMADKECTHEQIVEFLRHCNQDFVNEFVTSKSLNHVGKYSMEFLRDLYSKLRNEAWQACVVTCLKLMM